MTGVEPAATKCGRIKEKLVLSKRDVNHLIDNRCHRFIAQHRCGSASVARQPPLAPKVRADLDSSKHGLGVGSWSETRTDQWRRSPAPDFARTVFEVRESAILGHEFRDGRLGNLKAEHRQFAMDPGFPRSSVTPGSTSVEPTGSHRVGSCLASRNLGRLEFSEQAT
jgi:hypothetical protein